MSVQDKIVEIKKIITLICDVVPSLVAIVKETIMLFKAV